MHLRPRKRRGKRRLALALLCIHACLNILTLNHLSVTARRVVGRVSGSSVA